MDRKGRPYPPSRFRQRRANPARSREPVHVRKLPAREPRDLGDARREEQAGGERLRPHAPRVRRRGVGAGGSGDARFEQGNDSNKGGGPSAESREGSDRATENVPRPRTDRAQKRAAVSQWLEGVRQAARRKATEKFTSLLHHLTPELLRSSFYALKRQAAAGAGGVSWREYESGLEDRLADLDSRVQSRTPGGVSRPTFAPGVHTQTRRAAASAGHHRAGGQNCLAGGGDGSPWH